MALEENTTHFFLHQVECSWKSYCGSQCEALQGSSGHLFCGRGQFLQEHGCLYKHHFLLNKPKSRFCLNHLKTDFYCKLILVFCGFEYFTDLLHLVKHVFLTCLKDKYHEVHCWKRPPAILKSNMKSHSQNMKSQDCIKNPVCHTPQKPPGMLPCAS